MALTAILPVTLTMHVMQVGFEQRLDQEITASHARSLIGDRSTDVASPDQHTIKPWLSGKLDFSPPVSDLGRKSRRSARADGAVAPVARLTSHDPTN